MGGLTGGQTLAFAFNVVYGVSGLAMPSETVLVLVVLALLVLAVVRLIGKRRAA
jgi:hypothetical protein